MGIKSQSVNLYHNFYTSDLLIASPLGLRRILGGEGDKERDVDFLSSIEMVILDQVGDGTWLSLPLSFILMAYAVQADVYQMQNFDHVTHLFEHLNQLPTKQRDTDINRIRLWALEGLGSRFRQTIILSSFVTPELARLWRQQGCNLAGKQLVSRPSAGSILAVIPKISQVRVVTCACQLTTMAGHTTVCVEDERAFLF